MKSLIILLVFCLIAVSSCKKEMFEPEIDSNSIPNLKEQSGLRTLYYHTAWYYGPDGNPIMVYVWIFCGWPSRNCLNTVVVGGNSATDNISGYFDEFTSYYENDNLNEYFQSNSYKSIFPELDNLPGVVGKIQDSRLRIQKIHSNDPSDMLDYYVGTPNDVDVYSTDDWLGKEEFVLVVDDQR